MQMVYLVPVDRREKVEERERGGGGGGTDGQAGLLPKVLKDVNTKLVSEKVNSISH